MSSLSPSNLPTRSAIEALQEVISTVQQLDLKTEHYFAGGVYMRTLWRPKGALIVGKVHRREHIYMVVFGDVTVTSDGFRERIQGPRVLVCKPGTKRAVFAHEDSLCLTVHRTEETQLERVEADLVEEDPTSMYLPGNVPKDRLTEDSL
jgi:hypothetical protein